MSKYRPGDIVNAVCTTYLGTKNWDCRITAINDNPDYNIFSPNNYIYLAETVCGQVHIMNDSMVHYIYNRKLDIVVTPPTPDKGDEGEQN